ncbi:MAG: peptide synthetase, partial [Alphaproteobacteria bacterium]|nr:peptide synthetase [Alphaproteobacteria bacterium]
MSRFSCYIITDSTLGIQCAEHLLQKKHKIFGIVSQNQLVSAWCKKHDIPLINFLHTFEDFAHQKNFDYLFSIVNSHILTSNILSSPQKLAINFHDAPLPKYAGVHATSWAILNQEKKHGVTWHIIEQKVDAGDVLNQELIPIDSGETALSLDIKCYLTAIKTFKALCDDLSQGTVSRIPQDLTKRTFFGAHKKPASLGFVDWKEPGNKIETLFRALSFGDYPNALSSFKILFSSDYFCPKSLKILYKNEGNMPGTILKVSE